MQADRAEPPLPPPSPAGHIRCIASPGEVTIGDLVYFDREKQFHAVSDMRAIRAGMKALHFSNHHPCTVAQPINVWRLINQ